MISEAITSPLTVEVVSHRGGKAVALKCGEDQRHAAELQTLISDAQDGVRRIAAAGAKIEWLVRELPHGGLGRWLETYLPEVHERTVRKWRDFTKALFEAAGANRPHGAAISLEPHKLLVLPIDELPAEARGLRAKLDEIMAGRTFRQLCFEFKQVDDNGHAVRGRRPGKQEPRAKLTLAEETEARETEWLVALKDLRFVVKSLTGLTIHHTGLRAATVREHRADIEQTLGMLTDVNHVLREQLAQRNAGGEKLTT